MELITFSVFVVGLIFGSFLNVVVIRSNSGLSITGRSKCFSCAKRLKWFELIPILSFLILRGKCRSCKSKISIEYPMVEIVSGLVFVLLWASFQEKYFLFIGNPLWAWIFLVLNFVFFLNLIAISSYDLKHMIIRDEMAISAFFIAILNSIVFSIGTLNIQHFYSGILGSLVLFSIFVFLFVITKGKGMGFGDAKLALSLGFFLGLPLSLSAFVIACYMGALFGLFVLAIRFFCLWGKVKNITIKREIPFAPFLVLGTLISYVLQLHIFVK